MADRPILPHERLQWGLQGVDWQERINFERLRKERYERTVAKLKKYGVAVALLSGVNQRYATAVMPSSVGEYTAELGGFALVFADYPLEESIIYISGPLARQGRKNVPWIKPENMKYANKFFSEFGKEFVAEQVAEQAKKVKQDLKEKGLEKEQIGILSMMPELRAAFENEGLRLTSIKDAMVEARMIKTVDEINLLKQVGNIGDKIWYRLYESLKPGVSECELAAEIGYVQASMQPTGVFNISPTSGPNIAPCYIGNRPSDRIILVGDIVYADLVGPMTCGYRSCYCRNFKIGALPTDKEKGWHNRAYEWLKAGEEACKPGNTTADVAKCWPSATIWGGPNATETEYSPYCIAHGIGLTQHEYPMISRMASPDHPLPLEKGMVIALETWDGEEGVQAVRLEDVIVITDTGYEICQGNWPNEELIVPQHSQVYHRPYGA